MGGAGRKQILERTPQHEGGRKCPSPRGGFQKEELVVGRTEKVRSSWTRPSPSHLRNILVEAREVLVGSLGWRETKWLRPDGEREGGPGLDDASTQWTPPSGPRKAGGKQLESRRKPGERGVPERVMQESRRAWRCPRWRGWTGLRLAR